MKKQVIILLLCSILSAKAFGQESDAYKKFPVFNIQKVTEKLFGATAIKINEYTWKPTYAELFDFADNVSYDGYCHTKLDTAIDIKMNGSTYMLITFSTSNYATKNEIMDCHACAPTISVALFRKEADKSFTLEGFKKGFTSFGSYGQRGQYAVEKIGADKSALVLISGYTNQGYTVEGKTYYSLTSVPFLTQIFTYETETSDSNTGDEESNTLKTMPNAASEYYDLVITSKKNGKISPVKRKYSFYTDGGIYIPSK